MEGQLWKWTNYWNGWQSRWFILEDGILSYYKSYDEVSQGCKGSINVSACEINVNPTDNTRLDLTISGGEQYMYLRASSEKERQRWLIALGSAKACLNNRPRRNRVASTSSVSSDTGIIVPSSDSSASLETKKSELRLYSDLLMQQVHMVKAAVRTDGTVDTTQLEEGASLLPQTCDMFMKTLESVMRLTDANFVYTVSTTRVGDVAAESALLHQQHTNGNTRKTSRGSLNLERSTTPVGIQSRRRRPSSDSAISRISPPLPEIDENSSTSQPKEKGFQSVFGVNYIPSETPSVADYSPESTPSKSNRSTPVKDSNESSAGNIEGQEIEKFDSDIKFDSEKTPSPLRPKFPVPVNGLIETNSFLLAAEGALRVYDFFGSPQFSIIKSDAENLILPIRAKFSQDTERFTFLGSVLQDEFGLDPDRRVISNALSGLVQHLKHLHNFLRRFLETNEKDISACLLAAFEPTTQQQPQMLSIHRAVFEAAKDLKLSRADFVRNFGVFDLKVSSLLKTKLYPILADYLDSMEDCLRVLLEKSSKTRSKS